MEHILYSNYNLADNWEDAVDFLKSENSESDYEPSEQQVWNLIYADNETCWDEFIYELREFFAKPVIVFGNCGRWDGMFSAGAVGNFENIFYKSIEDCDYVEAIDEDGTLYIRCSHHDGTNYYQINEITNAGLNLLDEWNYDQESAVYNLTEKKLHEMIISDVRYSLPLDLYKKIGGMYD